MCRRRLAPLAIVAFLAAEGPARALALAPDSEPRDRGLADLRPEFEAARARAVRKLEEAGCLAVLGDFRDGEGRTLSANLAATGLSADTFFGRLDVRDGRHELTCQQDGVAAFTFVGRPTVWLCSSWEVRTRTTHPEPGPDTLIHEMLHALGLPENPPTSAEINRRVRERCGR